MFVGPVFIVGFPRSGTKLLRDLLNRNRRISIPEIETHFIPYLIRKYGSPAPLGDAVELERFGDELRSSTFYGHMRSRGFDFNLDDIASRADLRNWSSIFEQVLRHFAPKSGDRDFVFGDKTPDYLKAMELLRVTFKKSRFVHIIRDPRDVALSAWKVWGQHPYRTAHRWQDCMARYRGVGHTIGGYMEVRYEDLLMDPSSTLQGVCRFLDCEFHSDMLVLERSNENAGDAMGATAILSSNTNKFWRGFSRARILRIEEICFAQLRNVGYPIHLAKAPQPLGEASRFVLGVRDLVNAYRAKIRKLGPVAGIRYVRSQRRDRVRT